MSVMDDQDTCLYIPVAGSDEVVAVPVEDLPEEAEDLLDILKAEEAPLSLWIDFAKAYLAQVIHWMNVQELAIHCWCCSQLRLDCLAIAGQAQTVSENLSRRHQ